jgi:hypothetical protein
VARPAPERHFAPDYRSARTRFLAAAEAAGARVTTRPLSVRGPAGEELALDVARLGPEAPARMLVVSSGIHGVEGFAGSAVQHHLLSEQLAGFALPRDTALLLVHAINPHGFAHLRRVNESNVDLNRNFLRHPEEHVANPDYDLLHDEINPETLDPERDAAAQERLLGFAREHGFAKLQEVLSRGQYVHPHGVQYGGAREEGSNRALRAIVREQVRGARHVAWVDVHTGLGPFGEPEMITECPREHPAYARGRAWYGEAAKSTASGDSVSAHLCGVMEQGLEQELRPETELTAYAAEFGTYDPIRVFRALRADNWLAHRGDPGSDRGRAIKAEILEVFRPAHRGWQARVLAGAARVLEQTRRGLLGEAPRARSPAR